jgi:DNA-binding NarL/FixJ family response regulator
VCVWQYRETIAKQHRLVVEFKATREAAVLRLIVQGYTNHQMAGELKISARTVESHLARLMANLNARSRVELIRCARTGDQLE